MSTYEENRLQISTAQLQQYTQNWVAFSLDGRRILAGAKTLADLEERLAAQGQDPEKVAFEYIEFEDSQVSGADLL